MIPKIKNIYIKYLLMAILFSFGLYKFLSISVLNSPVFDITQNERQDVNWEYLSEREKRNEEKMKMSYQELMALGEIYVEQKNWEHAIENFYWAKTIFPENIDPRKNLCYSYFMKCQEDRNYCFLGKKELYYAMKYVNPSSDYKSFEYLNNLVDLVGLNEVIEKNEEEALAFIY